MKEVKQCYLDKKQLVKVRQFCIAQVECIKCPLYNRICSRHTIANSNIEECKFILGTVNEYYEKEQN